MRAETATPLSTPGDAAVRRLEDLIKRSVPALTRPGEDPPEYVPPKNAITPLEAQGFFRAVDAGLFDVEAGGYCMPRGMRPGTGYCYPLLDTATKTPYSVKLWREWLTHAAAPASLHLDFGYSLHDIAIDVGAFDVLVYSPQNQPLVAVEAKKTSAELDAMLRKMLALQDGGWELRCQVHLSNAVKKFRSLLALRPGFFLAVAPGVWRTYQVMYGDDRSEYTASLTEIERVPSA